MSPASSNLAYDVFRVSLGWCAAARSEKGICAFVLPINSAEIAEAGILAQTAHLRVPGALAPRRTPSALRRLAEATARYFNREAVEFDEFPVDLSSGTAFQQKVWSVVGRIPYGQVRTYRWIGVETGWPDAAQAIGQAVGANPVPLLIPCHRVVGADGSMVGFSAAGGVDLKARMLEIEGVRLQLISGAWRVSV